MCFERGGMKEAEARPSLLSASITRLSRSFLVQMWMTSCLPREIRIFCITISFTPLHRNPALVFHPTSPAWFTLSAGVSVSGQDSRSSTAFAKTAVNFSCGPCAPRQSASGNCGPGAVNTCRHRLHRHSLCFFLKYPIPSHLSTDRLICV